MRIDNRANRKIFDRNCLPKLIYTDNSDRLEHGERIWLVFSQNAKPVYSLKKESSWHSKPNIDEPL